MREAAATLYIGLMSGTSLDGVDGVLAQFSDGGAGTSARTLASAHVSFPSALRAELMALQQCGIDEVHREALAANQLALCYHECVGQLLMISDTSPTLVDAIGAHGQTIRHRPELGYTRQINNGALLAELTGIDVITDFRSRDIAAGGQGAPLVPLFHQHIFGSKHSQRVVANIGGIGNISVLTPQHRRAAVVGFDTGPGNVLLDLWIHRHSGQAYDDGGNLAASGTISPALLQKLLSEPFFSRIPPKSTGRDLFNAAWLDQQLVHHSELAPADVQATLTELTARTLSKAIREHARAADTVYICGGGAFNTFLLERIEAALASEDTAIPVLSTAALGIPPDQVEALAFAWLAQRFMQRAPGNSPSATGAAGERICGALYPR
jgi:anhydro-N-acetylmuramic acid kinase